MNARDRTEYEVAILEALTFEFRPDEEADNDRKIRDMLKRRGLGDFDEDAVASLRALKNAMLNELSLRSTSAFHTGSSGTARQSDWDTESLVSHFSDGNAKVSRAAIEKFLPFAILNYYQR